MQKHSNDYFYPDGVFDEAKAKQAYFEMMEHFHYPILESFKGDQLWCPDFDLGDFANVGMGGVFWMNHNHEGGGYLGHEIFLLPGQMIVEHSHVAVEGVCPAKSESWLIRHGSAYNFSTELEPTGFIDGVEIPESQKPYVTVNSCKLLEAGDTDQLNVPESSHFLMAGPEGAIITEFATFHVNEALRFTHPKLQFQVKES
jgi:D-lyxose ketol-isomerase